MGGVRTALYNYLFARRNKGVFILRIEDTDQKRYVKGAEEYIINALEWCGIEVDEGLNRGGEFGPYRQSERKDIYRQYADILLDKGFAYYAFDTPGELEEARKENEKSGKTFTYDATTRENMSNSLVLSEQRVKDKKDRGVPYVIRFRMPENEILVFNDIIRGRIEVNTSTLDDKVLFKSDGMPTYHLANVVDDHLMQISHVIRGEEWLPSLPLHVLLYRAFQWDKPEFAHMPLTLKPDGKGKLSKRDGDRLGFPVFPIEWKNPETGETSSSYRESGYFPDAFINILAFLGWNPGTEKEIFSMDELIEEFSLERVVKAGSRFDPEKAKWFNQQYLRMKTTNELMPGIMKEMEGRGLEAETAYIAKVLELVRERMTFIHDFWEHSWFFFIPPEKYDDKVVKKRWKENSPAMLEEMIVVLESIIEFSSAETERVIKEWIESKEYGMGQILSPFRLAIVGGSMGPHLFDIIGLIGKKETITRLRKAIDSI